MNNQVVNVDLNIDGETLNVEAIDTRRNNNTTSKNVINSMNTNNNYVWSTYPNEGGDNDITFTECLYWQELNSDINDVWSEMEVIDEASDIPEFSSLIMPIASVLAIVGYNNRRKKN